MEGEKELFIPVRLHMVETRLQRLLTQPLNHSFKNSGRHGYMERLRDWKNGVPCNADSIRRSVDFVEARDFGKDAAALEIKNAAGWDQRVEVPKEGNSGP